MSKGLYVHFPFCEKKCNYCDFYSVAGLSQKGDYVHALCRELSSYGRESIDTVYFGGGTPSLMTPDELEKIMACIKVSFDLDKNAEITLEANPSSIDDKLSAFHEIGINRLSLGVQSFNDNELSMLGRAHSSNDAISTIEKAKKAGFDNLSLDLMFAIPKQTVNSFEKTLDVATSLSVEHISVYALGIEEKTVFGIKQKRGENLFLPNEDEEAEMYLLACDKLGKAGYEHYEISNFTKTRPSRHNLKYWQSEEYIGIGASAHSYYKGERYSTPSSVKLFLEGSQKEDCYKNTALDRAEEFIFLSLRLKDGLNLRRLENEHSVKLTTAFHELIPQLVNQGLCNYSSEKISLTEKGFFVSNTIIVKILDSLQIFS